MSGKKVLLICFEFPPTHMTGAIRPSKWAKYLLGYGWEVFVLTVKNIYLDRADFPQDVSEERVFRTHFIDFWRFYAQSRALFRRILPSRSRALTSTTGKDSKRCGFTISSTTRIPDRATGWIPFAIARGIREIRRNRINVIVSTSGPPSNHIIAWALHKLTRKPWVADFRDPWTTNPFSTQASGLSKLESRMEKNIIRQADMVTTVSDGYAENLSKFHHRKVEVVYNGFDEEDLPSIPGETGETRFILTYTGSLNADNRNPAGLFEAVRNLMEKGVIQKENFLLSFYGTEDPWLDNLAHHFQIGEVFHNGGILSRSESLSRTKFATAMVVIDTSFSANAGINLPTKIFDYVNLERRVLAVTLHHSDIEAFLWSTNTGLVCETVEEIENTLTQWLTEFQAASDLPFRGDLEKISQFSRWRQAGRLAEILNTLTTAAG